MQIRPGFPFTENYRFHSAVLNRLFLALLLFVFAGTAPVFAREVYTPADYLKTRRCTEVSISPAGEWIAYTVSSIRGAGEEAGPRYSELYLVSSQTGRVRPFITGKVNVHDISWSPDGKSIAFLRKKTEKDKTQVWAIPAFGGEAVRVTGSETDVLGFRWHPDGEKIAYLAVTPPCKHEKQLKDQGYEFIYYEENLKHRNLYIIDLPGANGPGEAKQLTEGVAVWDFEFNHQGNTIAAAVSPKNLIDQSYMFRKIHLLDLETGKLERLSDNPGKLGNFAFSPDGGKIAYTAALERKDHAVSQVYVIDLSAGGPRNLTMPEFRGHVSWVGWKDGNTVVYRAAEGVWNSLSEVAASGGERRVILHSEDSGVIFSIPEYTADYKHFAFTGSTPQVPEEVYYWQPGKQLKRLTNLNPWLGERTLGAQEVVRYRARDGLEIEGILVYPAGYSSGELYPLIVSVHGGPEAHYSNGWLTRYFNSAQVLAGKGYAVFFPNYRASTGYGVRFALEGFGDPAGKEFDDIADGIEYLVGRGIADKERVGLGGGSYGGFASAWFASYYTKYVRAVCMFVGISDLVSKRGTTDIPYELLYVHFGKKLEDMWQQSIERSPLYWAHQSKTAVLIVGGADDTRVHPSQSLEFYRRLKMNDHPAVRLVQYPGERHGNRSQPGIIDLLYRHLQWYDWYVRDARPLEGPLPPLDISDCYGLEPEEQETP